MIDLLMRESAEIAMWLLWIAASVVLVAFDVITIQAALAATVTAGIFLLTLWEVS